MKQTLRPFLAGAICFLVIYGALWLVGFVLENSFATAFGGNDILAVNETPSPNQTYIATTYTAMGGGAAGWCYRSVSLRKNNERFKPDQEHLFSIQCDAKVEAAWTSESKLLIKFASDETSLSVSQKSLSNDKVVSVSYAADTPGTRH